MHPCMNEHYTHCITCAACSLPGATQHHAPELWIYAPDCSIIPARSRALLTRPTIDGLGLMGWSSMLSAGAGGDGAPETRIDGPECSIVPAGDCALQNAPKDGWAQLERLVQACMRSSAMRAARLA